MKRTGQRLVHSVLVTLGGALLLASVARGQQAPREMTLTEKIASATSSAPAAVASQATILDWPASPTAQPTVLRHGTNGWVCYPDFPGSAGTDPVCLDKSAQAFVDAHVGHKRPQLTSIGVVYMLAPGSSSSGSNTDPYATAPTPDNQWGQDGPRMVIVVPDVGALQGLPTTRQDGAPFVMWAGTAYAHIMVPLPSLQR